MNMAIRHMTYRDIPEDKRREAAGLARNRLRSALGNSFLAPEQAAAIHAQIEQLDLWERGEMPVGGVPGKSA